MTKLVGLDKRKIFQLHLNYFTSQIRVTFEVFQSILQKWQFSQNSDCLNLIRIICPLLVNFWLPFKVEQTFTKNRYFSYFSLFVIFLLFSYLIWLRVVTKWAIETGQQQQLQRSSSFAWRKEIIEIF